MKIIYFFYCCCFTSTLCAFDNQREIQYAIEIKKNLQLGSAIQLPNNNHSFLALYTDTEALENKGTAILLHDQGRHPDQRHLIHALRTRLPLHNWATLSLQMPLREFGSESVDYYALFPEAMQRIQAGIDYLQKNNVNNVVLVGYGMGSLMAIYFINEKQTTSVKALITIGLPAPETEIPTAQTLRFLNNINVPLLDIYGTKDIPAVSNSARNRRNAARENPNFRQLKINHVGRSFRNYEDLLVKRIYSWLSLIIKNQK